MYELHRWSWRHCRTLWRVRREGNALNHPSPPWKEYSFSVKRRRRYLLPPNNDKEETILLKAFRNTDDIRATYNLPRASRNISDRLETLYRFFRQPRPHMTLEVSTNKRCMLFQKFPQKREFEFEYKMITRRKELYGDFRANLSQWRIN